MNYLPVIVLGSGGHARVLIDTLLLNSIKLLGMTDVSPENLSILGVSYLGDDDVSERYSPSEVCWLTVLVQFRNRICVKNYFKNADSHNKRKGLNMAVESGNMFIWPLGLLFVEMFTSKNLYMLGRV